jgi:hypothetical protein
MMNRKKFLQAIPILAVMIFGCELIYPKSRVTPMSSTSLIVYDKGQIEHFIGNKMLEIKAGHFARGKYIAESGKEETGLVATLWILLEASEETMMSVMVYTGKTVIYRDYKIQILRVEMDQPGVGFVEFEITMNGQADTTMENGN